MKRSVVLRYIALLCVVIPLCEAPRLLAPPGAGQILEINLGPVPVELYSDSSLNYGALPSCPFSYSIPRCIQYFLNNNPQDQPYSPVNYVGQGVVGVRFMFEASKAWDRNGRVQPSWVAGFRAFMKDMRHYGIRYVTPTPVWDNWDQPSIQPSKPVYDCTGTRPLTFYRWMPFGHVKKEEHTYWPDCQDRNSGYYSAAANPYFWGWSPFFNLIEEMIGAVRSSGLLLRELDLTNEIDLLDFTVSARLIYDNKTSTDVYGTIRRIAGDWADAVAFSVPATCPSVAAYDCSSVYGDSATIMALSELHAAFVGGPIGLPDGMKHSNNLVCGGTTKDMVRLPRSYQAPGVIDVHVYPQVTGSPAQDTTSTATRMYDDIFRFRQAHYTRGATVVIGETQPNQNCEGFTAQQTLQNVNGYAMSLLAASIDPVHQTVLRPWNNDSYKCYAVPSRISPPYPGGRVSLTARRLRPRP